MTRTLGGLALVEREEAPARLRLALVDHTTGFSRDACALTIDRLVLHDGTGGTVRIDGIGNVATLEEFRGRGLATTLLEHAIEHMRHGDAAGSLLYGIDGFYDPFGWRTCGDERWVSFDVTPGRAERATSPADSLARARPMQEDDRQRIAAAYERIATRTIGAVSRAGDSPTWSILVPDEVMVVERGDELVGWAWRGAGRGARGIVQEGMPGAAAFLELQAVDVDAAWHVVQAARAMVASSDEAALARLATGAPDGHPLRELARGDHVDARLVDDTRPHGGAMLLRFTDAAAAVASDSYQFVPDRF